MFRAHGFERSVLCSVESDAPGAVPAGNGQGVDLEAFLLELEMIKSKRNLSINYNRQRVFTCFHTQSRSFASSQTEFYQYKHTWGCTVLAQGHRLDVWEEAVRRRLACMQ